MKNIFIAVAAISAAASTPAFAEAAAAPAAVPAAAPAYSTSETDIGTLLDNPATKAVLQKYIPAMISNPQFDMARSMTLKQIQGFAPDQMSDDLLAKIDADLKTVAATK